MNQSWKDALRAYLDEMNKTHVDGQVERLAPYFLTSTDWMVEKQRWQRSQEQLAKRQARPVKALTKAVPQQVVYHSERELEVALSLWHRLEYRQKGQPYRQEYHRLQTVTMRRDDNDHWVFQQPWDWFFEQGAQQHDIQPQDVKEPEQLELSQPGKADEGTPLPQEVEAMQRPRPGHRSRYNRQQAVAYAEQYWNSYNPAFRHFDVDCTNFVSQCLYAGGIEMMFSGSRSKGWWYRGGRNANWSFSWAVAHSLYLLLASGKAPFYAERKSSADQLSVGDVICYDFNGDGKWQHNTIVVAKDADNMPLVNAHTTNSRMRYWEYRDSSAYTPRIQYGFFHIRA
ncbi:amidase domain-containing protein [Brevibacillus fulvus]|uniref:Putative amidase domain-containing protein n=1 Tax=Brevibacillus fulvus TaxID=1125967 RepID=A0A939BVW6_9BACL|nr:hypothetical protein [Brevibacillus fulvus]